MDKDTCTHGTHTRRHALKLASAGFVATAAAAAATTTSAQAGTEAYADPAEPALPQTDVTVELSDTALVVTDPQIDFLSPDGVTWGVVAKASPSTTQSITSGACWEPLIAQA